MTQPATDGVCEECGYDYDLIDRDEIAAAIREAATRYGERLSSSHAALRGHSRPGVWSALEYACHVRDVLAVQRSRVRMALEQDGPAFPSMRREERVTEERYNEQEPADVARQVTVAADALATELASLDHAGWTRTGIYNYPRKQVRTVEWIAHHTLHEAVHHLFDIDRLAAELST